MMRKWIKQADCDSYWVRNQNGWANTDEYGKIIDITEMVSHSEMLAWLESDIVVMTHEAPKKKEIWPKVFASQNRSLYLMATGPNDKVSTFDSRLNLCTGYEMLTYDEWYSQRQRPNYSSWMWEELKGKDATRIISVFNVLLEHAAWDLKK
jgi:hypothetical protein